MKKILLSLLALIGVSTMNANAGEQVYKFTGSETTKAYSGQSGQESIGDISASGYCRFYRLETGTSPVLEDYIIDVTVSVSGASSIESGMQLAIQGFNSSWGGWGGSWSSNGELTFSCTVKSVVDQNAEAMPNGISDLAGIDFQLGGLAQTDADATISYTITISEPDKAPEGAAYEGYIDITCDAGKSWWNKVEISLGDLLGNVSAEDVTYIVFTCDAGDQFAIGYNSVNEISAESNWTQTDNLTTYTAEDIDLTNGYNLMVVAREYDGVHTIYWSVYTTPLTAIQEVKSSVEAIEVARYNLLGQKISGEQKGINIIVYSDGSSKKVLVK